MTSPLTASGYERTKAKLAELEQRLAAIERRTDLKATHKAETCRSDCAMIRQYKRESKLFEATRVASRGA